MRSWPGEGWIAVERARFSPQGVLTGRGRWSSWWSGWQGAYASRNALGWGARFFLADMVVEFGRDRFARFWTSDAPLEEAFEQAMETPLDEWTMRWARRYHGTPRTTGRFSSGSVLLSLLLAGVFVGAAGVYSRRRQVI